MKLILDSSAILSGIFNSADHEFYTSPSISQEMEKSDMVEQFNYLIDAGLRIMTPSLEAVQTVLSGARKTGDINRLSKPDIELLSLALELNGVILTNDYSIQNLASELNIRFLALSEKKISKVITWEYKCKGCARIFDKKEKECPICGSEMRFRPKNIKKA